MKAGSWASYQAFERAGTSFLSSHTAVSSYFSPQYSAPSPARLAVEPQDLVGVALRLRVAVAVEDRGGVLVP